MKNLRKTKIICTIGPSSESESMIRKLVKAGMNCARINCSHGTCSDRQPIVSRIKKIRKELDIPLPIMLDTKGPEFRIKTFKCGKALIKDGSTFTFTINKVEGDETIVSVTHKNLCKDLKKGDIILVNDGLVKFKVKSVTKTDVICKTVIGGLLSDHKSMNFPGKNLSVKFLSKDDKQDLLFAIKNNIDFVAASFVSCADDVKSIRKFLNDNGGSRIAIIAKIENQSGIDNLKEIVEFCDGIMVARGDLGVEIDFDKLPSVQKEIIYKSINYGKLVITSTEMLESMIVNPRPTRAEVSDVANAVYDGSSAIMLSGETAAGKYPVEAVKTMSKIAKYAESKIPYKEFLLMRKLVVEGRTVDAIAKATCNIAIDVEAKGIVNLTASGFTSELMSNYRSPVNILSITNNQEEFYKLGLYWGINPVYHTRAKNYSKLDIFNICHDYAKSVLGLKQNDKFVLNSGWHDEEVGYTNDILVDTI